MKTLTMLATLLGLAADANDANDGPKKSQMQCRDLTESGNIVGSDETLVDGKVCKKGTALNAQTTTPRQTPVSQPKPRLIVTSAEGHRFRNSMIAGALTGGVGLAAGMALTTVPGPLILGWR